MATRNMFLGFLLFFTTGVFAQIPWGTSDPCDEEEDLQLVIKALGPGAQEGESVSAQLKEDCKKLDFVFEHNSIAINNSVRITLEEYADASDLLIVEGPSGTTITPLDIYADDYYPLTLAMDDFYTLHGFKFMNASENFVLQWLQERTWEPPTDEKAIVLVLEAIFYFCNEPNISQSDLLEFQQRLKQVNKLLPNSIPVE